MGLPYSDFVLNIQPDDYQQLNNKIQYFLDNPARLRHMQVLLCSCTLLLPVCSSCIMQLWDLCQLGGCGGSFIIQPSDLYRQEAAEAQAQSCIMANSIYGKVDKACQTCCMLNEHRLTSIKLLTCGLVR